MVRLSLHRHVPLLLATTSLTLSACGRSLLGESDTDGESASGETDPTGDPSAPTDPSSSPTDPSTTASTNPTDPTGDPTGTRRCRGRPS